MEYKEIQNLIKLIDNTNLAEFKLKEGEFEIHIRTKDYFKLSKQKSSHVIQAPVVHSAAPSQSTIVEASQTDVSAAEPKVSTEAATPQTGEQSNLIDIKSPIVGTFYRAPSPDKDVYVKIGDHIEVGSVVCIVEAMKLFNEIESEVSGKIVEILVDDATPVEYDQVLFRVQPA
jgi:acetyl-CoA carboxylase biotin carboxyl carrier protein